MWFRAVKFAHCTCIGEQQRESRYSPIGDSFDSKVESMSDADSVAREDFYLKFNELLKNKRDNCVFLSKEKYDKLINEVTSAKEKTTGKQPQDYKRLKRFDILRQYDIIKLIVPLKEGDTQIQYYVTNEEMYDVLNDVHERTGHGGRTRMLKELQLEYKNVTYEVVMLYISLCKHCKIKHVTPARGNTTSKQSNQMISTIRKQSEMDVKSKWHNLRSNFMREKRKLKNISTGSDSSLKITWPYFEAMKFLDPALKIKKVSGDVRHDEEDSVNESPFDETLTDTKFECSSEPIPQTLCEISVNADGSESGDSTSNRVGHDDGNTEGMNSETDQKNNEPKQRIKRKHDSEDGADQFEYIDDKNPDVMFLLSILPSIKKLSSFQSLEFKGEIIDILKNKLYPTQNTTTHHSNSFSDNIR